MDLKNLLKSIEKEEKRKAIFHATKLKKKLQPVANDYPFKEKDRVWIVRDEHNYEPGTIAVIKEVKEHNGIFSYTAKVVEDHDGSTKHYDIHIAHTRDAHLYY